jgi:hypothetical protein
MLALPTVADLTAFTGRSESYPDYANTALAQAGLLFTLTSGVSTYPDDADLANLVRNAIMDMANRMVLEVPYAATKASPLASETIGSYSYTKSATAAKAASGSRTGLLWWDLAMQLLMTADQSVVASGSVLHLVEAPLLAHDASGTAYLLGPADDPFGPADLVAVISNWPG